jgi:hypothetical protein
MGKSHEDYQLVNNDLPGQAPSCNGGQGARFPVSPQRHFAWTRSRFGLGTCAAGRIRFDHLRNLDTRHCVRKIGLNTSVASS